MTRLSRRWRRDTYVLACVRRAEQDTSPVVTFPKSNLTRVLTDAEVLALAENVCKGVPSQRTGDAA